MRRPRPATVLATLALTISAATTAIALPDNSVSSKTIVNGEVSQDDIGFGAVFPGEVQDETVTGSDIADQTLKSVDIGAVQGDEVEDESLTDEDLSLFFEAGIAGSNGKTNLKDQPKITSAKTLATETAPEGLHFVVGSVVINNAFGQDDSPGECRLRADGQRISHDPGNFIFGDGGDERPRIPFSITATYVPPEGSESGTVTFDLRCSHLGGPMFAQAPRVTALRLATLSEAD